MMTCKQFDGFIPDYLERNLDWRTRLSFSLHSTMCGKCTKYLVNYRKAIALCRAVFAEAVLSERYRILHRTIP